MKCVVTPSLRASASLNSVLLYSSAHLVLTVIASSPMLSISSGCSMQKSALMRRVAHQAIVMQYILELAKQLDRDPRSCAPGFFVR